jgi:hypothetical protein
VDDREEFAGIGAVVLDRRGVFQGSDDRLPIAGIFPIR